MKTLTPPLEKLLVPLRGVELTVENKSTRMSIYPCKSCSCDTVLFWIGYHGSEHPVLNIDLNSTESINIATTVHNYLNPDKKPMTSKNFLTLLNYIFVEDNNSLT